MPDYKTPEEFETLLTKKQLAKRLSVTQRSIDNYTALGIITRIKLGALSRYDWKDVVTKLKNPEGESAD